jgi:hypothetical protein
LKVSITKFVRSVSKAKPLVRGAAYLGLFLKLSLGKTAKLIPVLGSVANSADALLALQSGNYTPPKTYSSNAKQPCSLGDTPQEVGLIIIGSGPGGALAAMGAKSRGENFIIVEGGGDLNPLTPSHSFRQMFESFANGGQDVILSYPPIPFTQGEAWGGGSEINSGLFHKLPKSVAAVWAAETNISQQKLETCGEQIAKDLKVGAQGKESMGLYQHSPMIDMGRNLGWEGGVIPRWRTYLGESYIHHGVSSVYLSTLDPNQVIKGHKVEALKSKPNNIEVKLRSGSCTHTVLAQKVCLSAGTLETPRLLIKSRLAKASDFKFSFHAMIREVAEFDHPVNSMKDIDPHQYWSSDRLQKIGAAVGTPELLQATIKSRGANFFGDIERVASYYTSVPSEGISGVIKLFGQLHPFLIPSRSFKVKALEAQETLKSAIVGAGGKIIGNGPPSLSTVHIFGTLPIGSSKVIDNKGRLIVDSDRIYIRDASLLPSHPLVNPQGPLMQLILALES